MTVFLVCDRCGFQIGDKGHLNVLSRSQGINADLCPKCAAELAKWIKEMP